MYVKKELDLDKGIILFSGYTIHQDWEFFLFYAQTKNSQRHR